MVLQSEDLDEIDWEWLGGDGTQAQTNYFGKGNTTSYDRGTYQSVSSPQTIMHTYSFDWTEEKIDWLIDGVVVRTLMYADAVGGKNFPQTPMRLKLGNWIAGDPATNAPGTIEWAGGDTDFSQAPFTMYVKTVSITNYNPAAEYEWTDKTGSYESIKLVDGSSGSSSSSASGSATQLKSTAVISNSMNTVAPTSSISVKKAQAQDSAAVVASSNSSSTASTLKSVISSVSASATSAAASASASASKSSSQSSFASATSSQPAQQSTNAGVSNTVATGLFSVVGAAVAFFIL
ncbi:concanavalin A-like lectin/glucanase, partial [Aureobasidium melanogenum]